MWWLKRGSRREVQDRQLRVSSILDGVQQELGLSDLDMFRAVTDWQQHLLKIQDNKVWKRV